MSRISASASQSGEERNGPLSRSPSGWTSLLTKLLFVLLTCGHSSAQDVGAGWLAHRWGNSEGLPVDSVNALAIGPQGYLWLATFDGLARFDGVRFTIFRSAEDPQLPSDRLTTLAKGPGGTLWATTEQKHLVQFQQGRFTHYNRGNGLPDEHVISWEKDQDGTLWFGTQGGVAHYREGSMAPLAPDQIQVPVNALAAQGDGTLWLGSKGRGVLRYRNGTIRDLGFAAGMPSIDVQALHLGRDGTLWAGTTRGLARLKGDHFQELTQEEASPAGVVLDIEEDRQGVIYAAASNGLFAAREGRLQRVSQTTCFTGAERLLLPHGEANLVNFGTRLALGDQIIFSGAACIKSFLIDQEGSLWIGTSGDGLYRLRTSPLRTGQGFSVTRGATRCGAAPHGAR